MAEPGGLSEEAWLAHRPAVFGVAYRLLGSVADAEDVVQDVWLRAAAADLGVVRDLRAWLVTVSARRCYDVLRSARVRRERYVGPWLPEPTSSRSPPATPPRLPDDHRSTGRPTMARLNLATAAPTVYAGFTRADAAIRSGPLPATVRELVKLRVSQLNGCVYCVDLHSREARQLGETEDRLYQLPVWSESELFDERERAALAYAEAATRRDRITDELWATVRASFPDDAEAGHLVAQVSLINALNLIGVPLEMRPLR